MLLELLSQFGHNLFKAGWKDIWPYICTLLVYLVKIVQDNCFFFLLRPSPWYQESVSESGIMLPIDVKWCGRFRPDWSFVMQTCASCLHFGEQLDGFENFFLFHIFHPLISMPASPASSLNSVKCKCSVECLCLWGSRSAERWCVHVQLPSIFVF